MLLRQFGRPQIAFSPPDEVGAAAPASPSSGSVDSSAAPSSPASGAQESPASRGPDVPSERAPDGGTTEAGAGDTSDSSFDFIRDIFGDTSGSQSDPGVALEGAAAPQQREPQQPPAAAPAAVVPPVAPAEVGRPATEQPASPPQQGLPQYDPADPHSLARGLVEHQAAAIENLAKGVFRLEPAEIEALETDFAGNIPKLFAKAAVFSQQQFLAQLGNIVPQMIQRMQQQTQTHQRNANRFYEAWPGIDQTKHGEIVNQLGVRYRKMFPEATLDQMIEQLGPLVLTAIGAQPTTMTRAPGATQPGPAKGNGVRSPSPAGFVPAAPGQVVQSSQIQENPYAFMGTQTE